MVTALILFILESQRLSPWFKHQIHHQQRPIQSYPLSQEISHELNVIHVCFKAIQQTHHHGKSNLKSYFESQLNFFIIFHSLKVSIVNSTRLITKTCVRNFEITKKKSGYWIRRYKAKLENERRSFRFRIKSPTNSTLSNLQIKAKRRRMDLFVYLLHLITIIKTLDLELIY